MKKYSVLKTKDQLIKIEAIDGAEHTQHPNEKLIDIVERAYFCLKEQYGTNYIISTQELQRKAECAPSTFNSNIIGGVNGLIALIEKTVLFRFTEAVEGTGPDLDAKLRSGLHIFFQVAPNSRYNAYKKTSFNMSLRTEFAVKQFSPAYWRKMLIPLIPAIDTYLQDTILKWQFFSPEIKEQVFRLSAENLRYIAELIVQKDFESYGILQTKRIIDGYTTMFKDMLCFNVGVWLKNH